MNRTDFFNRIYLCANLLLSALYPDRCPGCGEITDGSRYLCEYCEKHIEKINPKKRCLFCGLEKPDCDCREFIYYFDRIVSVYMNENIAKRAVYSYKLSGKSGYASFFAQEMASVIKDTYKDINFDCLIPVPTTFRSFAKYGFSPVKEICYGLSELLDIPLEDRALKCIQIRKMQHKSTYRQRLQNVKGKFYCNKSLEGKIVLLADDIKTTGATLSECARVLKFAGAEKVYCATVLAGKRNKDCKTVKKKI